MLWGALVLFCYLLMNAQSYQLNKACVFFLVEKLIKKDICILILALMTWNVAFLETYILILH